MGPILRGHYSDISRVTNVKHETAGIENYVIFDKKVDQNL